MLVPCTPEYHEELRADPITLRHHTEPGGVQFDEHGAELFEWRRHTCGFSFAAPLEEGVPVHVDDVP